jgi:plastocyanin
MQKRQKQNAIPHVPLEVSHSTVFETTRAEDRKATRFDKAVVVVDDGSDDTIRWFHVDNSSHEIVLLAVVVKSKI